ncbi:MAG: hypothetical protein ACOX7H_08805 [Bacillota bacterium]|jgi:hypothetical protein
MEVKQIYELMNAVTNEVLGKGDLVTEDLSNVVDIGTEIINANAVDNYVRSLVDHIGKVVFVNRPYSGSVPSVLMDGWEYGSICEKISADMPEATENETWDLKDGTSYDPNIFYQPKVSAKFFNKRVTFEVPMSFTERQVKESFSSAAQLNGFISMLYNEIDKSMTVKIDALVMRTINNMIGETLNADFAGGVYSGGSGVKAVNLLYLYNQRYGTTLTAANAITEPDFIRFASYEMGVYMSRMSKISSLFNIGGKDRFTPADMLHVVMLADFKKAANVFLQSDVFHDSFTELPNADVVPYWQGSGKGYDFADISAVKIKTASGATIDAGGIIGVMFDRDALGVTNLDRRVTTNYNPKAEFYNNWYKFDAGYFNDTNENFVVFFVA